MAVDDFVNLANFIPSLKLDIRYATTDNFTQTQLYSDPLAFLRLSSAKKLQEAQQFFLNLGLCIKVLDAYRPLSVQKKLWEVFPDDRFVANPAKGSRHNRGAAIDLTLVDQRGVELEMPTAFDEFSPKAISNYADLPENVIQNREILMEGMLEAGFVNYPYEWWHFDDQDWEQYPICDFSFEELISFHSC